MDRRTGRLRRQVLERRGRGDGAEAVPEPYPPIWLGGSHPDALRRAVRLADGFMGAGSTTTADLLQQAHTVRTELDRAGRDPAGFHIAKRVYLAVDDDPTRAFERLSDALNAL